MIIKWQKIVSTIRLLKTGANIGEKVGLGCFRIFIF
jgi:hypothetical protein